jgi:putative transposase
VLQSLVDKTSGYVTYPTDLSDQQWALIEPLLPPAKTGGRPRTTDTRRVVDAILYLVKNGCLWRYLPSDFPPWRTVYEYFKNWRADGTLKRLQQRLVKKVRRREGRPSFPSLALIDSQSVKTGRMANEAKGFDGGKRTKGRKRHIVTDTLGMIVGINVTSANTHDTKGGRLALHRMKLWLKNKSPRRIYADGGYAGETFARFARMDIGALVTIKKGLGRKTLTKRKGFVPIKKRWVVERTLGWLSNYRRLDKDQERLTRNSVAMIRWAAVSQMLGRLFPNTNLPVWISSRISRPA